MTRTQQLQHWLNEIVGQIYQLQPLSGDASFRHYFRLQTDSRTMIVMDAPPDQEDCTPFVDVAKKLSAAHIHVPAIIASDLQQGFLLLSDLGNVQYLQHVSSAEQQDVQQLYQSAMDVLIQLHQIDLQGLPPYGEKLINQEMVLFIDWFLQKYIGLQLSSRLQIMLDEVFKLLTTEALQQPQVFVHRDYHSRNLMVCTDNRLGVLDFQDAVCGPWTYDLVSLLKDCYIKWPAQQIQTWANHYFEQFTDIYTDIDHQQFKRWFDLMGVQRHLKAIGIFARLWLRDGKPQYLSDIPITLSYITDLKDDYPELTGLIELLHDQRVTSIITGTGQ